MGRTRREREGGEDLGMTMDEKNSLCLVDSWEDGSEKQLPRMEMVRFKAGSRYQDDDTSRHNAE